MTGFPPGKRLSPARAVSCLAGLTALAGCSAPQVAGAGTPQTTTAVLAWAGQSAPRSAVPWSLVGRGWALAEDFASPSNPAKQPAGSVILYLVDPLGGRYKLFAWSASGKSGGPRGELTDWSGNARRALFGSFPKGARQRQFVQQLNLRTGKLTGFWLPAKALVIGYTRPGGKQVLAQAGYDLATGKATLARFSFSGRRQKALWRAPGLGSTAYSPDGQELVTDSYGSLVLLSNAGGVIRHLRSPALCDPVRWWNSRTILVSCAPHDSSASRMWLVPASGAPATALTPQRSGKGPDQGDNNLFRLPSGTYLNALARHCGNSIVVRQQPGGKVKAYSIAGAPDATIVTATASRLLLQEDPGCTSPFPTALAWYNPVTGRQAIAIPLSHADIGVLAVVPYTRNGKL